MRAAVEGDRKAALAAFAGHPLVDSEDLAHATLAEQLTVLDTTVDESAADVQQRLAELDVTVGLSTSTTERSAERLGGLVKSWTAIGGFASA